MFRRFAWQEVCKFLAGAFFVSAGVLLYLYVYRVSIPVFNTGLVETPEISRARGIVHAILFAVSFYFGFIRRNRSS